MGKQFTPTEIVFAPTAQCNLECAHCRVDRSRGIAGNRLTIEAALSFLEDCSRHQIDRVGFSGGEPFLEASFIEALCQKSVDLGLYFDRLMTNGVWFRNTEELETTLQKIFDAGFDGTIGISVDNWHNQNLSKVTEFIRMAGKLAKRFDFLEIISVLDRDGAPATQMLESLASCLDAKLIFDKGQTVALENAQYRKNRKTGMDDGSGINIPVVIIPYSADSDEAGAWNADNWFSDDFCQGPGNIFYVHPDDSVAVCCGFANENPELIAGTLTDSVDALLASAKKNPHIRACYEQGLGAYRKQLETDGMVFPGKTADMCFFCDWLCKNGHSAKK